MSNSTHHSRHNCQITFKIIDIRISPLINFSNTNLTLIFSIAALWTFDSATNTLKNKKGYKLTGKFDKQQTGADGSNIKAKNGEVLGFEGTGAENTKVELQKKSSGDNNNQIWKISQIDNLPEDQGFFTIESVSAKMLLHGDSKGKAFLGSEFSNPRYDYDKEPKSKLITSRKGGKKIT